MVSKVKKQSLKISIDNIVKVKLTEFGWSVYESYFSTYKRPKTVNGYLSMPFTELMNVFGCQLHSPYDERFSVFVDNEIIYDIPNNDVMELAQKIEDDFDKNNDEIRKAWESRMRSFKKGDKVVKTIGSDKSLHTYLGLIMFLGTEHHKIKRDCDGRIAIMSFFEVDYA